MLKQSRNVSSV